MQQNSGFFGGHGSSPVDYISMSTGTMRMGAIISYFVLVLQVKNGQIHNVMAWFLNQGKAML